MNLSEPLDGLMSVGDASALRVLSRTDAGLSGRQVHSLTSAGSPSGVNRALARFVALGIVRVESRPPANIYRLNREHALWPAIELGLGARERVFELIAEFCGEVVPDEVPSESRLSVLVYGSVARRESTAESDIDIFVVYPDGFDIDARADIDYRLADYVESLTGNRAQIFSITRGEVAERIVEGDALVTNVMNDGILLFGWPLRSLEGISV